MKETRSAQRQRSRVALRDAAEAWAVASVQRPVDSNDSAFAKVDRRLKAAARRFVELHPRRRVSRITGRQLTQ